MLDNSRFNSKREEFSMLMKFVLNSSHEALFVQHFSASAAVPRVGDIVGNFPLGSRNEYLVIRVKWVLDDSIEARENNALIKNMRDVEITLVSYIP
ncbi:MAG: hypothetical protein IPK84_04310 [Candidatus Moraniibacteriota bacterium]|nr:MAG: hypothetical protein IPK84_04310 [Candidatus Moranbacteria bacterium]